MSFKLGKQEYVPDVRTLKLMEYVLPLRIPARFDFDKRRSAFPVRMWGNGEYGDCVIAGRANHLLRLERVEQRRTVPLFDQDVIDLYKSMTGCNSAGDSNDTGLVVLEAMRQWRNVGWTLPGRSGVRTEHDYTIAAYGEIEPGDYKQLRTAVYAMHGVQLGFWLPISAQRMTDNGLWDYNGESGSEWQPGSWGGHLVYAKAYDEDGLEILTWGMKVKVTNNFINKYCDEAWAVVDSFDSWRIKQTIDVAKLTETLFQITTRVNE